MLYQLSYSHHYWTPKLLRRLTHPHRLPVEIDTGIDLSANLWRARQDSNLRPTA